MSTRQNNYIKRKYRNQLSLEKCHRAPEFDEDEELELIAERDYKKAFVWGYHKMLSHEGETDLLCLNYDQARHLYKKGIKYKVEGLERGQKGTKNSLLKLKNFIIDSSKDKTLVLTPFKTNVNTMILWLEHNTTEEDEKLLTFLKLSLAYAKDNIFKYEK